jgi:hypothetical protein
MTDHDDTQLDAALAALARPDAPPDHVARVLARTSAETASSPGDTRGGQLVAYLRPRWAFPVAATVLAVLGATWQIERQVRDRLDDVMALNASHPEDAVHAWGRQEEVDLPVLPPQAYWGMDAFAEFATLRPGARVTASGSARGAHASDSIVRLSAVALAEAGRSLTAQQTTDDELAWAPVPSGLPVIELESIAPAPLVAAPVSPIEEIAFADIPLAPIVVAPLDDQERP